MHTQLFMSRAVIPQRRPPDSDRGPLTGPAGACNLVAMSVDARQDGPPGDDDAALADRTRLLEQVLRALDAAPGSPDGLDGDDFRAAWLAAGALLWPHRLPVSAPIQRPAPDVWTPAPDQQPAPLAAPACSGAGDDACGGAPAAPRLFARRLELRTLLGTGKCGQTWRAYHHILGRDVAVKVLPRALSRTPVLADLCREAMALDKLTHRAFPRIYECDHADDGAWYLVEEFIDGETLARTIQRGPMDPLAAVELIAEAAEALAEAHAKGILHGDISHTNLMLERSLPPRLRIIDFSECRFQDAFFAASDQRYALTPRHEGDAGRIFAHPGFAAPELFRGGVKTERSDIYSLGAVLFMLLTGAQCPTAVLRDLLGEDGSGGDALRDHLVRAAPELAETFLAEELQDVLAPDPARRVAAMSGFLEVLRSERDALRQVRRHERADEAERPAGPRAPRRPPSAAPASPPTLAPPIAAADSHMSPRTAAPIGAAAAVLLPLAALGIWLLAGSRAAPPAVAPAPAPITAPRTEPTPPRAPAPPPATVPTTPQIVISKGDVRAALLARRERLRACPDVPERLSLTVDLGPPVSLVDLQFAPVDPARPLDACVAAIIAGLELPPPALPTRHSLTIALDEPAAP